MDVNQAFAARALRRAASGFARQLRKAAISLSGDSQNGVRHQTRLETLVRNLGQG